MRKLFFIFALLLIGTPVQAATDVVKLLPMDPVRVDTNSCICIINKFDNTCYISSGAQRLSKLEFIKKFCDTKVTRITGMIFLPPDYDKVIIQYE